MKKISNYSIVAATLLLIPLLVLTAETRVGKYAGEFMAIGIGGRALGLGSAYVAVANDVTAGYWNPAALATINYPEFSLMHDERFGNLINYDYGAIAYPFGSIETTAVAMEYENIVETDQQLVYHTSTIGISIMRLGIDGIADTRNAWNDLNGNRLFDDGDDIRPDISKITYFNAADWAIYLSYAQQYSKELFLGANLKLIRRNLGDFHGTGFGFDLGALYFPFENMVLGANLQDATMTLVSWNTGTNELISPTLRLGAAYGIEMFGGRMSPILDADIRFESRKYAALTHVGPISLDLHGGLEFDYRKLVALRAGINDIGNLTVGAGVHLRKLDVDYAFAKFDGDDQLGNSHRISLRFVLEEDRFRRGN